MQKKDFIIERTKEYLFILENKNEIMCKRINNLEKDKTKLNEIIKNQDEQIKSLKEDMKK